MRDNGEDVEDPCFKDSENAAEVPHWQNGEDNGEIPHLQTPIVSHIDDIRGTPKVTKSPSPKRRRTLADPPVRPVNSLRNSNVRPLPTHIRPCECRCKKGECPIYTSRQEHSKGRRFYCCPFNRTPQDCRFFEWIDDADDPIIELKFQLENHEETMTKYLKMMNNESATISLDEIP
ncbi:hypothetical protein QJS10_CPB14g00866 [Acorus calamus]|uniref:GRF-type domain-containing protein n=1 Tax=Acorus calamus TaxID=4465 RepID=A0AAV9D947_ACOCL|nr:hypothetical protein QJS10_CPB14g00866 [Acorus calamus]